MTQPQVQLAEGGRIFAPSSTAGATKAFAEAHGAGAGAATGFDLMLPRASMFLDCDSWASRATASGRARRWSAWLAGGALLLQVMRPTIPGAC